MSKSVIVLVTAIAVAASWFTVEDTAAARPAYIEGVDVSHHQGIVNWGKIAASGVRFAFVKATEGNSWTDPLYASNRAGAEKQGLLVGAYHFARPDGSTPSAILADARAEADHFVATAAPHPGELLPVLDLESNDGHLSPSQLTAWALAWLTRVGARIGAKPLVYSGYKFFEHNLADTVTFAAAGYMLWFPCYGVTTAIAPANNWDGKGWTFWQYTSTDHVPGIVGNVDRDRFAGPRLSAVTVPGVSAASPSPTSDRPPRG
jgi:lysozyme